MSSWAQERPLTPQERVRAEYLLTSRLPCLGCHSLHGRGGAIGPALDQVGSRRTVEQIRAIIADPVAQLPGTVMPRTAMTDDTRERIARYLASRKTGGAQRAQLPRVRATAASGALLYAERCAACHGARGKGDGRNAQFLMRKPAVHANAALMSLRSDARVFDGIAGGGLVLGLSPEMPAYGESLTREQIWSLVRHIRELCSCNQPAWANGR